MDELKNAYSDATDDEIQEEPRDGQDDRELAVVNPNPPAPPQRRRRRRYGPTGYEVELIDGAGNITRRRLDVADFELPADHLIFCQWNDFNQPIGLGGNFLNKYLAHLGSHFQRFPIHYKDWRKVPLESKKETYKDLIAPKFLMSGAKDPEDYAYKKIGDSWRWSKYYLYNSKDKKRPFGELVAEVPREMTPDQWRQFCEYKRSAKAQRLSLQNTANIKKKKVHHTAGSKSFGCTYEEERTKAAEENREFTYLDFYKHTHKRRQDGSYICPEAAQVVEKMEKVVEEQRHQSQDEGESVAASQVDPLAPLKLTIGREDYPGRCKGFGFGAKPSEVYGRTCSEGESSRGRRQTTLSSMEQNMRAMAEQHQKEIEEKMQAMAERHQKEIEQRDMVHQQERESYEQQLHELRMRQQQQDMFMRMMQQWVSSNGMPPLPQFPPTCSSSGEQQD